MEGGVTDQAPDLARLRKMYEEWFDLTQDARQQALIDRDYYDGDQWTTDEKAALAKRGQPDNVFNRVRAAVNGIRGVKEQGRSEPRAYPRTPRDEDSADVATDVLRFIADENRFNDVRDACFKQMLVEGTMAGIVEVDEDGKVKTKEIQWSDFFHDPRSRREDFKDARYLGIAKWMYAEDVKALYPDKADEIEACAEAQVTGGLRLDEATQDQPTTLARNWNDPRSRRIRVVEVYHREGGTWMHCVYHGTGLLDYGESAYLDDKGRPACPIEAQSAYVKRNNSRYGVVRDMRGPQDEINKRRSKLLHSVSVSQIQAVDPSAVEVDPNIARAEAARPDGVIPFGWQKVSTADVAAGQAQLLAEAKAEIERLGPNPAVVGRDNADASGRALQARTQAGLIELAPIYAGLEDWELRVFRQCWSRAKQFWREPMWIRVTDDEDAPKFVLLNEPQDPMTGIPEAPQPGEAPEMPGPDMQRPFTPGQMGVMGYKNNIAEMDVDITLDTQQDTANIQAEQFQDLMQMIGANPTWAQSLPLEVAIQLSGIPHKRQLLDQIKQAGQAASQMQAQAAQIASQKAQAEIEVTKTQAALNAAKVDTELAKPHIEHAKMMASQAPPPGETGGPPGQTDSFPPQQEAGPPPFG